MTGSTSPKLSDVAKAAGVSTATISRCLNEPEKVSKDTRERVLKTVRAMGYTPNFGARALAAKRTFTIGAIVPTMENAIFARGLQAFQERLNERGYTLLVSSSSYEPKLEAEQVRNLVARGADGLFLIGYDRPKETYDFLRSRKIPFVLAWAFREGPDAPVIGFDNCRAMKSMTQEVLRLGHHNIGVISGITDGNDRASERLRGVREALGEAGLGEDQIPIIEARYSTEQGAKAANELLSQSPRPTAIICGNDVLAVGAMQQAMDFGLKVPADISITGFDDIDLARIVRPQLTTVHVPHRRMGTLAANELVRMVEQGSSGASKLLESTLQLRGSLGPLSP